MYLWNLGEFNLCHHCFQTSIPTKWRHCEIQRGTKIFSARLLLQIFFCFSKLEEIFCVRSNFWIYCWRIYSLYLGQSTKTFRLKITRITDSSNEITRWLVMVFDGVKGCAQLRHSSTGLNLSRCRRVNGSIPMFFPPIQAMSVRSLINRSERTSMQLGPEYLTRRKEAGIF